MSRLRHCGTVHRCIKWPRTCTSGNAAHYAGACAVTGNPWPPRRCCWSGCSPSVTCPCACRPTTLLWSASASACNWKTAQKCCSTPIQRLPANARTAARSPACYRARLTSRSPRALSCRWRLKPGRCAHRCATPTLPCATLTARPRYGCNAVMSTCRGIVTSASA
ncbi:hypothetical protein D9M71_621550 [compost metagenome]